MFRALLSILPRQPAVAAVMVDFEAALWLALAQELSDVVVKGCTFHFCQAVWRKVQELGLQTAYTNLRRTHSFIRYYTMFVFAYFVCR